MFLSMVRNFTRRSSLVLSRYILGVQTVDDLLERIDEAVEKAKIIVDDGQKKAATRGKEDADNSKAKEDEPIRISPGDVHNLEDLLALINNQPGHRKVVLEGAPGQSKGVSVRAKSISAASGAPPADDDEKGDSKTTTKITETPSSTKTAQKTETPSSTTKVKTTETPTSSETTEKTETPTSTTKAKTTETPTSATTTKKTEAAHDAKSSATDQIHVNIANVQSVDELLDRVDEAVQKVPVVIDFTPHQGKDPGLFHPRKSIIHFTRPFLFQ